MCSVAQPRQAATPSLNHCRLHSTDLTPSHLPPRDQLVLLPVVNNCSNWKGWLLVIFQIIGKLNRKPSVGFHYTGFLFLVSAVIQLWWEVPNSIVCLALIRHFNSFLNNILLFSKFRDQPGRKYAMTVWVDIENLFSPVESQLFFLSNYITSEAVKQEIRVFFSETNDKVWTSDYYMCDSKHSSSVWYSDKKDSRKPELGWQWSSAMMVWPVSQRRQTRVENNRDAQALETKVF